MHDMREVVLMRNLLIDMLTYGIVVGIVLGAVITVIAIAIWGP